jgi:spermidine synthase
VPDGGGTLTLMRRDEEFSIRAGSVVLMSSRMSGSEIALADVACERLRGRKKCRVLIGGYGMGFTLRAAMAGLGADAQIVVAELVPAVIAWARGPMAELTAGCLDDPRVRIEEKDVRDLITSARGGFDAILLDVDNGPDSVSRDANDRLYTLRGLHAARQALRPKGLLAIWSAGPSATFTRRLGQAGFGVEEIKARANKGRGVRHIIWAATNPGNTATPRIPPSDTPASPGARRSR